MNAIDAILANTLTETDSDRQKATLTALDIKTLIGLELEVQVINSAKA